MTVVKLKKEPSDCLLWKKLSRKEQEELLSAELTKKVKIS